MAASDVYICNAALSHIGTKSTISSLLEESNEARQCNLHFEQAREFVLESHPWRFAEKRVALASLTDPDDEWDWEYAYQYPNDCVQPIEILPELRVEGPRIPFEVSINNTLSEKVILTDEQQAYLKYTSRVTNAALYPASFVQAFAWYLAILIALPLTGKKSIRDDAERGYALALSHAEARDREAAEHDPQREAEHILARE